MANAVLWLRPAASRVPRRELECPARRPLSVCDQLSANCASPRERVGAVAGEELRCELRTKLDLEVGDELYEDVEELDDVEERLDEDDDESESRQSCLMICACNSKSEEDEAWQKEHSTLTGLIM